MSSTHLSAAPADPFSWRESVLSTRSLSYLSTADAAMSTRSRSTSDKHQNPQPARQNTGMSTDGSDYSLEITRTRDMELNDIPELPESVADSPLFTLPREIRDRIYAYCLTAQTDGSTVDWPTEGAALGLTPELVRVCRVVHDEAAPLLYTLNQLTFYHPSDANMFVRAYANPSLARYASRLSLHIKAQDMRIWMQYIMSRDRCRSLEWDFPFVKELNVRYRSSNWQHNLSPQANMTTWSEDSRLDELMAGLSNVYFSKFRAPKDERDLDAFGWSVTSGTAARRLTELPDPEKEWTESNSQLYDRPQFRIIKLTCACRVHPTHFKALTDPPSTASTSSNQPDLSQANNGTGVIQQSPPDGHVPPAVPVREGEEFRGFTAVDLRTNPVKSLYDPDLGSANVAQTPFTDKDGILLSLEIHSLDPKTVQQRE